MKEGIRHLAIAASAGSGKTYRLARRYIELLEAGVSPERIAAFTFSRKAAGEIFDKIVTQLVGSADPAACAMLRSLMSRLNRLHIGTIDSFAVGIVRAFPMELGIAHEFRLDPSEGTALAGMDRDVLDDLFFSRTVDAGAQREFLEAFKQATFGQETKSLEANLEAFLGEYRWRYRLLGRADAWGDPRVIWNGPPPFVPLGEDRVAAEREALLAAVAAEGWSDKVVRRFTAFADTIVSFGTASEMSSDVAYLLGKLSAPGPADARGRVELTVDRQRIRAPDNVIRPAVALARHVLGVLLDKSLHATRGLHRLIGAFETRYLQRMRAAGTMTFQDVQFLLAGGLRPPREGGEARLAVDYRLDGRLDHWLLDEFQDTSDLQWRMLRNLADEILQDDSGRRSFFYVGDVKQSIYGWRGGNPALFGAVFAQYAGRIGAETLAVSWRSLPAVIETVNRVFGSLPSDALPAEALRKWESGWERHRCREGLAPGGGYAALLSPLCPDPSEKPTETDRYDVVAGLLRMVEPVRRGLSTAVLVRSNDSGKAVVEHLRRACPGLPVVHEGRGRILDNPVVTLLCSLVQYAWRPGDTLASAHLAMSPLRADVEGVGDEATRPAVLLREIEDRGLQGFLREWGRRLDRACGGLDAFGRRRLNDLLDAAGSFGDRDGVPVGDFPAFVQTASVHESVGGDAVRVMTVHQSKGLGFDWVILPDLNAGGSMVRARRPDLLLGRAQPADPVRWVLRAPAKVVLEADPVLAGGLQIMDAEACFEELCVLYVAMTRAAKALHVVTSYAGRSAEALTPAALVNRQLAGDPNPLSGRDTLPVEGDPLPLHYECGSRDWYRAECARPARPAPTPVAPGIPAPPRPRLVRVSPSRRGERERDAEQLFARSVRDRIAFGSVLHALFRRVEWFDDAFDPAAAAREWLEADAAPAPFRAAATEQFAVALRRPTVGALFRRPAGDVELWREKAFEAVLDGREWVSGAFDRVVVTRKDGRAVAADALDFKSGRVDDAESLAAAVARYRSQTDLYRRALAMILNLAPDRIRVRLLFTATGDIAEV
jgi:ATP-dependent helicase/nuclease subunit A